MTEATKLQEWSRFWPLPMIAMLGITGPAAYAYTSGIFMGEMTSEFGWTKTEFSSFLTLQMVIGAVIAPFAGRLLDRVGSRRMLLAGIVPFALGLSALGLANGSLWQWWMLAVVYSIAHVGVIAASWVSGVVQSFDRSRGLAIAVCLAGIGIATAGWPFLVVRLIGTIGWRWSFPAMALVWALVLLPLTWFLYKPVNQPPRAAAQPLVPIGPAVWTRTFWLLLIAGGLFSSIQLGLIVHLMPTIELQGIKPETAANMLAMTGLFSVLGRICTGALLDWVPAKPLAVIAFLLPLPVMGLFMVADGSVALLTAASALLGYAAGSEIDVVAYLCSRRFDQRIFGTIYTLFQTTFSICASLGPLLAGWRFDQSGGYESYYAVAAVMSVVATLLIILLPNSGKARGEGAFPDQAVLLDN